VARGSPQSNSSKISPIALLHNAAQWAVLLAVVLLTVTPPRNPASAAGRLAPGDDPPYEAYLPLVVNQCGSLYADNYSNSASGWPIFDFDEDSFSYFSGQYRIFIKTEWWISGASSGFMATDFVAAVDGRLASNVYGSYGILFGLADNWSEFYLAEVDVDGFFIVWEFNANTTGWQVLDVDSSGALNTGTATNRLKVERNGSQIEFYGNGTLLTTLADSSFTGLRRIGLMTTSYDEDDVDSRYDNFVVYSANCDGEPGTAALGAGEAEAFGGALARPDPRTLLP
jgi:hypothetical protein